MKLAENHMIYLGFSKGILMGVLFNLPRDLDPCNSMNNLQTTMFSPSRWEFQGLKTVDFPERVEIEAVISRRKMEIVEPCKPISSHFIQFHQVSAFHALCAAAFPPLGQHGPAWASMGQHQNKHASIMPKPSNHYKMKFWINGNHFIQNISSL